MSPHRPLIRSRTPTSATAHIRHQTHAERAKPHARRSFGAPLLCALLGLAGGGCGGATAESPGGSDAQGASRPPGAAAVQADVEELRAALVSPELTAGSSEVGTWKQRRTAVMDRLKGGDPAVGRELLRILREERRELDTAVRTGFLEVAAHCATDDAVPFLIEVFETYGEPLDLRTAACHQLAAVAPAEAVERLQPILVQARPRQTWPAAEAMLEAFVKSCDATDAVDPKLEVLTRIATGILFDDAARYRALKELGEVDHPLARQAIEAALVESTGNGYLRRKAAQALLAGAPDECCAVFERVAAHEADGNFLLFLEDMLEKNCR